MPKQKTKKSLTKRFRITKKGKVLRRQGFRRHLNVKKSSRKKRKLGRIVQMNKIYAKKVKKALGHRTRTKKTIRKMKAKNKTKSKRHAEK